MLAPALLLAALGSSCSEPEKALLPGCEGCNVILISLDTLRADHLQPYGYDRPTSPVLDRLAQDGVLFENCIAQAPTTLPSHMSIFTSLYPSHHGVIDRWRRLSDETPTFVDVLHQAGYTTAAFTGAGFVREKFNYHTFDSFSNSAYYDLHNSSDDQQFEEMLEWLDAHSSIEQGFFLFWHTYRVHSPYSPAQSHDPFSDPSYDGPVDVEPDSDSPVCVDDPTDYGCTWKGRPYYDRLLPMLSAEDIQHVVDKYDGEILEIDAMLERLWQRLEASGLLENTVVVLTSDHGESFGDRERNRRIGHGLLYNEVLEVPLIFWVPGVEGARVGRMVESIDLAPTVLEIVGLQALAGVDGRSLRTVADNAEDVPESAYSEYLFKSMRTVIWEGFKLIENDSVFELYDLRSDPDELDDLWGTGHPSEQKLVEILATIVTGEVNLGSEQPLDDETLEELKALGYL